MLSKTKEISFSLKIYDSLFEWNTEKDLAIAKALGRAFDNNSRTKSRKRFHICINQLKKLSQMKYGL